MKKHFWIFAVLILLHFAIFAENRNALLIANSNYQHFGSLATPVKEARDLKETLVKLGFSVTILENGSREKMLDALGDFESLLAKKGGIGFFHYGGHAVQVSGKNYLIPVDADIPDEKKCKSRAVDLEELMTSMVADTNIVILDACRNNPLPSVSGRSATRGLVLTQDKPKNSIIVYSADAGKVAQDGLFTPILTKKLLEKKELLVVLRDVRKEVFQKSNGEQNPKNDEGLFEEIYLAGFASDTNQNSQKKTDTNKSPRRRTDSKSAEEYVALGDKEYGAGNYAKAIEYWQKGADAESGVAFRDLGYCYQQGQGVSQNYAKAVEFYKKAADLGNPLAFNDLGYCYELGQGVAQNYAKAFEYYKKGAELDNEYAQCNLGLCYEYGKGVARNVSTALFWYKKSAAKGVEYSREAISRLEYGW